MALVRENWSNMSKFAQRYHFVLMLRYVLPYNIPKAIFVQQAI